MREPRPSSHRGRPDVHLNLDVRGLTPSSTLAIQERCTDLGAADRDVFRLGLGQSPFSVARPAADRTSRGIARAFLTPGPAPP